MRRKDAPIASAMLGIHEARTMCRFRALRARLDLAWRLKARRDEEREIDSDRTIWNGCFNSVANRRKLKNKSCCRIRIVVPDGQFCWISSQQCHWAGSEVANRSPGNGQQLPAHNWEQSTKLNTSQRIIWARGPLMPSLRRKDLQAPAPLENRLGILRSIP